MPRPATPLPTANDFYDRLDRPPWHGASSVEVADMLGVPLNYVWNGVMRRTFAEPEPGNIHVRASNRRFFMPAIVLEWLSAREGNPVSAWTWARRWLADHHGLTPETPGYDSPTWVVGAIFTLEHLRLAGPHKWRIRLDRYLDRLDDALSVEASPC